MLIKIWEVLSGHYLPQIHMQSWPKSKLDQVRVGSNIAQNHSSSPQDGISGYYWLQFIWKRLIQREIRLSWS